MYNLVTTKDGFLNDIEIGCKGELFAHVNKITHLGETFPVNARVKWNITAIDITEKEIKWEVNATTILEIDDQECNIEYPDKSESLLDYHSDKIWDFVVFDDDEE